MTDRAGRIVVRRYASAADADREDVAYWQQVPPAERVLHVWRLSQELWQLKGDPIHERGLCRSVASVRRR